MKKHIIIGKPLTHSLSPKIHNFWFKENNLNAVYEKKEINEIEIKDIFLEIKKEKIFAMNVTVPYKQAVIKFLEELSPLAEKTKSVNTIFKKNGKIYGDNTDIFGFETALKSLKISFEGKSALIFGAGGVVPSIIVGLQNLGIKKIYISNRTKSNVDNIISKFKSIKSLPWGVTENFDIYINATSLGLDQKDKLKIDYSRVGKNKFFYDLIYNPSKTIFLKEAEKFGHKIENGKIMLIYQAQKAFDLWHGILPDVNENFLKFLNND